MKTLNSKSMLIFGCLAAAGIALMFFVSDEDGSTAVKQSSQVATLIPAKPVNQNANAIFADDEMAAASTIGATVVDDRGQIQLCQGYESCQCPSCTGGGAQVAYASPVVHGGNFVEQAGGFGNRRGYAETGDVRSLLGVNQNSRGRFGVEPTWNNSQPVPWESRAHGEYIGPYRTPHVPEYRLRVADMLEFVYVLSRRQSQNAYEINVGDELQILSSADETLNQPPTANQFGGLEVLSDGTISLQLIGQVRAAGKTVAALQEELNDRYSEYVKKPAMVVQVVTANTPMRDLIIAVSAVAGTGGQVREAEVLADGTISLPLIGPVPAIGLSLNEIQQEIEARYRLKGLGGVTVTPTLIERAPRFIYVVGEVEMGDQFELTGPTTAMQAIALAGGFNQGGNLRQVIVFRRDANWNLVATRLDLSGALFGRRPHPSDEIWLRDGDIVLVPKRPIQRLSETVDLYLTQTLYSIFPQEIIFDFNQIN